jgi:hypothetical protein
MLLCRHSLDSAAQQQIVDEINDCPNCLRDTLEAAVEAAHNLLLRAYGVPEMHSNGIVSGPSVDLCLSRIDGLLEAEELDRRDLG